MWILPHQLISLCAPGTGDSTSDSKELSQICAQSLTVRGKQPPSNSFSRAWKAGNLMRLRSGLICDHSLGERFLERWTSSLAATPASPSAQPASDSAPTTSGTSGLPSQMAFAFCDQDSAASRTSRDTSPLDCEKSLQNWKDSVTARRGAYSARLKSAHRTSESGCSSWPTAKARDWKDTTGCSLDAVNPDGTHRNRRDRLVGAIVAEMHGQAAPVSSSSGGNHRELWPTPDATQANDGVPWEKFHQGMMERRERVKQAVEEGRTKQGSGRSPNLCAAVQNPQWATPEAKNHVGYQVGQDGKVWPRLGSQVTAWATPQARDAKGAEGRMIREGNHSDLPSQTEVAPTGQWNRDNGKLNPRWVETLMGLPVGWTMASCAAPVTIGQMNCECWATE
jgi:hypothetical protein